MDIITIDESAVFEKLLETARERAIQADDAGDVGRLGEAFNMMCDLRKMATDWWDRTRVSNLEDFIEIAWQNIK